MEQVVGDLIKYAILLAAITFVAGAASIFTRKLLRPKGELVYRSKGTLLSPAERSFYGVLLQIVEGQYRVFSKVRLMDIIEPDGRLPRSAHQAAQNRIQSKHVDFILCDPSDLSIQCVVELDDSSHNRPDRQERDAFVNDALQAAGIPIFHIPVQSQYNLAILRSTLFGEDSEDS